MAQQYDENVDLEQDVDASQETEEIAHSNGALDSRMKALEENQQVLQLLNDPTIREVIQARQQGKNVKLVEEQGSVEEEEPTPSLTDGLEDTDPTKATLGRIEAIMKKREEKLLAKITEQDAQIQQLSGVAQEVRRRDVTEQITNAQKKYKDFGEYKTPMVQLSQKFPGLSAEQLYLLAKNDAGKLKMVEQATFSEKPSAQPSRSATSARRQQKPPVGRQGFSSMLTDVLSKLEINDQE